MLWKMYCRQESCRDWAELECEKMDWMSYQDFPISNFFFFFFRLDVVCIAWNFFTQLPEYLSKAEDGAREREVGVFAGWQKKKPAAL